MTVALLTTSVIPAYARSGFVEKVQTAQVQGKDRNNYVFNSNDNDEQIRAEIQLRESISFRSDVDYVKSVHAAPDAVPFKRLGAIFTPAEAKEVQVRLDLELDSATLQSFFTTNRVDLQDIFGGTYIDHKAGGRLVLQIVKYRDSINNIRKLLPSLIHPNRLHIVLVDWSEEHIEQQFKVLSDNMEKYPSLRATVIDQPTNQVIVTVTNTDTTIPNGAQVPKNALPGNLAVAVNDQAVQVIKGDVTDTPMALMAGNGWTNQASTSNGCTLAFEVVDDGKPSMLTAGHCVDTLASGAKAYNFTTQIGTYSGVFQDGKTTDDGIAIDVGVLTMFSASTATDDIFRGGGMSTLDITGLIEANSYSTGNIRCFYGIASSLQCSAITNGSLSYRSAFNNRYYRDMFFTDAASAQGIVVRPSIGPTTQQQPARLAF